MHEHWNKHIFLNFIKNSILFIMLSFGVSCQNGGTVKLTKKEKKISNLDITPEERARLTQEIKKLPKENLPKQTSKIKYKYKDISQDDKTLLMDRKYFTISSGTKITSTLKYKYFNYERDILGKFFNEVVKIIGNEFRNIFQQLKNKNFDSFEKWKTDLKVTPKKSSEIWKILKKAYNKDVANEVFDKLKQLLLTKVKKNNNKSYSNKEAEAINNAKKIFEHQYNKVIKILNKESKDFFKFLLDNHFNLRKELYDDINDNDGEIKYYFKSNQNLKNKFGEIERIIKSFYEMKIYNQFSGIELKKNSKLNLIYVPRISFRDSFCFFDPLTSIMNFLIADIYEDFYEEIIKECKDLEINNSTNNKNTSSKRNKTVQTKLDVEEKEDIDEDDKDNDSKIKTKDNNKKKELDDFDKIFEEVFNKIEITTNNLKSTNEEKEDLDQDSSVEAIIKKIIKKEKEVKINPKDYNLPEVKNLKNPHFVIFINGLGRDKQDDFKKIKSALQKEKNKNLVLIDLCSKQNINRPNSVSSSIEKRAKYIQLEIAYLIKNNPNCDISFVTHSQGGVTLACMKDLLRLRNIKNVITLASPFKGAELASFVGLGPFADIFFNISFNEILSDYGINVPKGTVSYKGIEDLSTNNYELQNKLKENLSKIKNTKIYLLHSKGDNVVTQESAFCSGFNLETSKTKSFTCKGKNPHMDILTDSKVIKYITDTILKK